MSRVVEDHLRKMRTSELMLLKQISGDLTVRRIEAILLGRNEGKLSRIRTSDPEVDKAPHSISLQPTPPSAQGGDLLSFNFSEPPTINRMIGLAKPGGRGMVYYSAKKKYERRCLDEAILQGKPPPPTPWSKWSLQHLHYRTWLEWDWIELAAGAKWAVDALVKGGYVEDDSPREMLRPESWPTQEINRSNRGVTITIRRES